MFRSHLHAALRPLFKNRSLDFISIFYLTACLLFCLAGNADAHNRIIACQLLRPSFASMNTTAGESRYLIDSTIKDRDGNSYGLKIMGDNKLWLTDNLNINIPEAYCYENLQQNCNQYGRLYTWKAAREGCWLLGAGWRLPTDEDWLNMINQYGGSYEDSLRDGRAAFKALLSGGDAGFKVLLGGGRDLTGNYARGGAHGFFWTATEHGKDGAGFYNFGRGSQKLYRQRDGEKFRAFSVRCVKDTVLLEEK